MKRLTLLTTILAALICNNALSQLTVNATTAAAAVAYLLAPNSGIHVLPGSEKFTGCGNQLATFKGGTSSGMGFYFNSGIILTTGDYSLCTITNGENSSGTCEKPICGIACSNFGDVDYTALGVGGAPQCPASLEFSFTCNASEVDLTYIFASCEWDSFYTSHGGFPDATMILVSEESGGCPFTTGPFSNGAVNIALTSTGNPMDVANIGPGDPCFINNDAKTLGSPPYPNNVYNGWTCNITAKYTQTTCMAGCVYHMKISVANMNDNNYDSGILLQAGSLKSNTENITVTSEPNPVCQGSQVTLTATPNNPCDYFTWTNSSSAILGQGFSDNTVTIPSSQISDEPYNVTVQNYCNGCVSNASINNIVSTPAAPGPYVNGINNSGNYEIYIESGTTVCFSIPTFCAPGLDVSFTSITGLPAGATVTYSGHPSVATICWAAPDNAFGDISFTACYQDNNPCSPKSNCSNFVIKNGCPNCLSTIYYQNRTPTNNSLPGITKAGISIIAGQSVTSGPTGTVQTGNVPVEFKAGQNIDLEPGFSAGNHFLAIVDKNTCVDDCGDCCINYPGITFDYIPNIFTPGQGCNDAIWYVPDSKYPLCSYNADSYELLIYDQWGNLIWGYNPAYNYCCPFVSDPNGNSIHWDGKVMTHTTLFGPYIVLNNPPPNYEHRWEIDDASDGQYNYKLTIVNECNGPNYVTYGIIELLRCNSGRQNSDNGNVSSENSGNNNPDSALYSSPNTSVYPNPANTVLNVEASFANGEVQNMCLYNSLGQKVRCQELSEDLTTISVSDMAQGIYFYRITDKQGNLIKSDKIMLIH